jgi:Domain of unknown function (DUF4307)
VTDPADSPPTSQLMAERYGAKSPRTTWLGIGALGLLVVALLVWLVWAAWVNATTSITGQVTSFDVVSQHRIDVTVQIARPNGNSAECTVEAQAVDHSAVGQVVVSLSASQGSDTLLHATIKTDREATSASVTDCH